MEEYEVLHVKESPLSKASKSACLMGIRQFSIAGLSTGHTSLTNLICIQSCPPLIPRGMSAMKNPLTERSSPGAVKMDIFDEDQGCIV